MRHTDDAITMIAGAANDGLGPAIASRLAAAHHHLALVDRRGPELRALADRLVPDARTIRVQTGDVLQPRRIRHFVDDMLIHYGRVDNIVFVPDHASFGPFLETTEKDLEHHLDVSVRAPWAWLQSAIPTMAEHGGGRIIFVSAAADHRGFGHMAAFHAAKGALHALVSNVALEHFEDDVRPVVLVLEGLLDHPPVRAAFPDKTDWSDAVTLDQVAQAVQELSERDLSDIPHVERLRPA